MVIPGAVVVGLGILRFQLDRLGEIGGGLVVERLAAIRDAAVVVGCDVIRLELDRLGGIGDGLVVESLLVIRDAAVVVGDSIIRLELDRLGVMGNGGVQVAERGPRYAIPEGRMAYALSTVARPR